jgi:alginate O-acetyltransferase complex protein AlgI
MLFNSPIFLFVFLPSTLVAYFFMGKVAGARAACGTLVIASLIYYGWWNTKYLLLIIPAIVVNAALGYILCNSMGKTRFRWAVLTFGICLNLGLLGYFKYANFFIANVNGVFGTGYNLGAIILPLGISFFVFQKIAFLVDAYRGYVRDFDLIGFFLFVTFFPQLIAGPIVHHSEVMPQFRRPEVSRFDALNFGIGISIFAIGLFKKIVIADTCSSWVDPIFAGFADKTVSDPATAWVGAIAYTFQLYFDFSGYSDMAIGLGLMFNVRLPINFDAPYKAASIIDFWRRWHMTLSRFLRDYLYIPLGGSRKGPLRRHVNLMTTMLLGGLWHGAQWQFVVWGGLHGLMLMVNHGWRALSRKLSLPVGYGHWLGLCITFFSIVTAWVLFRAPDLGVAKRILAAMYGMSGQLVWPSLQRYVATQFVELEKLTNMVLVTFRLTSPTTVQEWVSLQISGIFLVLVALVVFFMPNVYQIFARYNVGRTTGSTERPVTAAVLDWMPSWRWAVAIAALFTLALTQFVGKISPFIYYQF